jgi:DNA polymerase delta subunit 2
MKASYCGKVLDVKQGNLVWMVGTVYKEMKYKPNILDDVAASHYGAPPIRHDRYFDKDSDQILLEDESGRVQLFGSAVRDELLVTGIVVAVLGTETTDGGFDVADIKFPGYAPQMMRSKPENSHNGGRYVALVSGMLLGSEDEDVQKVELLQEYLCGELGGSEDQKESAAVGMLLIGGDSLAQQHVEARTMNNSGVPRFDSEPLHKFDSFIADVALSMPVSIMPGKADPTNLSMPQQPLNYSLLHQSRKLRESKSVSCVTNPSWWELDGTRVLGTSGQTIDDIHKYFDVEDRLEMMDRTLRWRHCAPTAPDTLWSYPFADRDPFILTESPHLYFVGNQDQFSTRLVESKDANGGPITTRLITVPRFKETGTIVLVNLETLDCKLVKV